jgi:hypothetical protein
MQLGMVEDGTGGLFRGTPVDRQARPTREL